MVGDIQFHEFQYIEAHANGFDCIRFTPTAARGASFCCFDHSVDEAITHGGAVAFESLADNDEEA